MQKKRKKAKMKPPQKELVADGNRHKPPRSKSVPSTTSSEAHTIMGDIDDEITTSASESYPQEETSSNEGKLFINPKWKKKQIDFLFSLNNACL